MAIGYDEDVEINAFHAEGGRLIFNHPQTPCTSTSSWTTSTSATPSPGRTGSRSTIVTIPLAELLLEKMQIVQINEKDIIDTIMLLREHEIAAERRRLHQLHPRGQAVRRRVGPVAHHDDEPGQDARLPAPPRPDGRGQGGRHASPRRAAHGHGRLSPRARSGSCAPGSATRSSGTRRSTEQTGKARLADWHSKKKDGAGRSAPGCSTPPTSTGPSAPSASSSTAPSSTRWTTSSWAATSPASSSCRSCTSTTATTGSRCRAPPSRSRATRPCRPSRSASRPWASTT